LGSEQTLPWLLAQRGESVERPRQRHHPFYVKPQRVVIGPSQMGSRDFARIRGVGRGVGNHLLVLRDIYSRYIVGWTLGRRLSTALAYHLLWRPACRAKG
jgi:transposase InsO family protein